MKKTKVKLATRETSTRNGKANVTHTFMACAIAVFLAFSYSNQMMAQTTAGSTTTTNNSTLADELKGSQIDYEHYRKYVTTNQPTDDESKIFLLYNVGAKKFLNLGGYWGMHAALSEVPRRFWLQRKNDVVVTGVHSYIRYPEAENTPSPTSNYTNPNTTFIKHTALQVGSAVGDVRTHATYKVVKLSKTSILGEGENVLIANAAPEGTAFAREFVGNLSENIINGTINLSSCVSGTKENILSIGTDIQNSTTSGNNINIYYDGTNITVESMNGSTQTATQTIVASGTISVRLHKGGLFINNVRVTDFDASNTVIQSLTNTAESIQIGSANSALNYSHATYPSLTFKKLDGENVVEDGYVGDGSKLIKYYPGSLSDYTIKAEIDLSNCTKDEENQSLMFSIGQDISQWGNTGTNNDNNIHFCFNIGWGSFSVNNGTTYPTNAVWWPTENKTVVVEIDKTNGIKAYIKGTTYMTTISPSDGVLSKLLDSKNTSEIQIGWNMDGSIKVNDLDKGTYISFTPSTATYTTLTVKKNDSSSAKPSSVATQSASNLLEIGGSEVTTIYNNVPVNGTTQNQAVNANFPSGDVLTADIDLSGCTTVGENVFSIGTDITKWGYSRVAAEQADNIHIYYLGKTDDSKQYKLYVANVNANHDNDLKRLFYVNVDEDLKVVLSKAGLTLNGNQIYTDTDPVPTVAYDENYGGEIIKFKYADKDNKIFYVNDKGQYEIVKPTDDGYADAEGIIGVYNGHLYTIESHDAKGGSTIPYFITSAFKKEDTASKNEGSFMSWAPKETRNGFSDIGVFGDRALPQENLWNVASQEFSVNCAQWYFEPVSVNGKNIYRIYLDLGNTQIEHRTGMNDSKLIDKSGKFYLQATTQSVYGINLENYYTGTYTDQEDKNQNYDAVEAIPESDNSPNTDYAYWKVISLKDYKTLFKASHTEMSNMLNISYMLSDPDFTRESKSLTEWQMDKSLNDKIRIGFDQYSKKQLADKNYTDDKTSTNENAYGWAVNNRAHLTRYMGVDVNGIDKTQPSPSGKFYQTVELTFPGWYALKCGGVTTVGSQLFVSYGDQTVKEPLHTLTVDEYTRLNNMSQVWPFVIGGFPPADTQQPMPMYNALVFMNDDNLVDGNIGKQENLHDATWHNNFNNQVLFYIDPDEFKNKSAVEVTIGIDVAPQTTTSSTENATTPSVTDVNWTVFDNFNLLYGGFDKDPYLILDEDSTNLDYLDKTIHKYRSGTFNGKTINKKLLLHRTFQKNQWNTIMLPVGLTKAQYESAFGDAPLAELTELTEHYIDFTTVTKASKYKNGTYDDTEYWLKPMTPYIIKPAISAGTKTAKYTAELYTWASNGKESIPVSIGGDGNPSYFEIDNINMVEGIVKANSTTSSFGSRWDFANMKTTINNVDYPYVMKGQEESYKGDTPSNRDGTFTAYGHLAKNFTTDATGVYKLIEGRASMADSYVISKNQLVYLEAGAASRGFRCWFQFTKKTTSGTQSAKPMLYLNGVDMATGIDAITANDEGITPIDQFKNGIFTLGGQLITKDSSELDQLPKGIYIVDGKKIVKK